MLRLLIEMVGLTFFQIRYGIKATKKGPAYFIVLIISFPVTATIKTMGKNKMASMNKTAKMPFIIFVRADILSRLSNIDFRKKYARETTLPCHVGKIGG